MLRNYVTNTDIAVLGNSCDVGRQNKIGYTLKYLRGVRAHAGRTVEIGQEIGIVGQRHTQADCVGRAHRRPMRGGRQTGGDRVHGPTGPYFFGPAERLPEQCCQNQQAPAYGRHFRALNR